ncbi:MAG: ATP-binding protein [Lacunisphaera sp.]|nr:ATP-binding protein [Lacunisphaera sp.]
MSTVTRKTEIAPLNGMPEKRMFWSIISDYDLKTGLTELVDNALDIWIGTKNRKPLLIELTLDADRQIVTLRDNAGGVPRENLRLLIAPGGSMNSPDGESIGIFGVGSKRAVVAVAERVTIQTHHVGDGSFQIDIDKEWLESPDWELPAYEIPEIDAGTTRIELSHLRKPLAASDAAVALIHFGESYEWFLKIDDCRIVVNGVDVLPRAFDSWAYPPDFPPRNATFQIAPDGAGKLGVDITAGLILDRDPEKDNYGAYVYCNNRLVVKELRTREVGYYVGSEAGVPHPDASLCRVIVRLNGAAKLMPWNSSKTGINYGHTAFLQVRPTLIQLVSHFSSLSRRLKDDWASKVFRHTVGDIQEIPPSEAESGRKLVLPPLPRVQKPHIEQLKAKNRKQIEEKPWTLGLVEAVAAVDFIGRQRLTTGNRIAMILLDSNFEIALKEFIVHRTDLYDSRVFNDSKIAEIFKSRHKVIQTVIDKMPLQSGLLERARHYYDVRNKLIHERATVGIPQEDIDNYRQVIEAILTELFGLQF